MEKIAVVAGATGLIGNELVHLLLKDSQFTKVILLLRHGIDLHNTKLHQEIVDFEDEKMLFAKMKGNVCFCCVGTTIKKAKTKENFRKVDYGIPVKLAKVAEQNGFESFVVVSSIGANSKSTNFYLKTKGEMEEEVMRHSLANIVILRPSMLYGDRSEFRFGERVGKIFMKGIGFILLGKLKKYRGIDAQVVANAMIIASKTYQKKHRIESNEIQYLVDNNLIH